MPEGDAPEDPAAAFRARARSFLEAHARPRRAGEDDFARFRFVAERPPGVQVLTSCSAGQNAQETSEAGSEFLAAFRANLTSARHT